MDSSHMLFSSNNPKVPYASCLSFKTAIIKQQISHERATSQAHKLSVKGIVQPKKEIHFCHHLLALVPNQYKHSLKDQNAHL